LNVPFMLLALLLAAGLGALHAVSPGHGKTIMAAYLVSTRGTSSQALLLGLTVTVTHTLGVLILGVITLFASEYIVPESLYPLLSLTSGVLVIGMGVSLALDRLQRFRRARQAKLFAHPHEHAHAHDEHDHAHLHGHEHSHDHAYEAEILAHGHSHVSEEVIRDGLSWKSLFGLGLAGGLVPSTSALILLLSAISLHRIPFGIVLIIAFGLGMAFILVGIGVLIVRAGQILEHRKTSARLLVWLPLASAVVVVGAGILVTVQALAQLGWFKL
jgi:ABC-type nickel/cobalt efflux system permease component RcnA